MSICHRSGNTGNVLLFTVTFLLLSSLPCLFLAVHSIAVSPSAVFIGNRKFSKLFLPENVFPLILTVISAGGFASAWHRIGDPTTALSENSVILGLSVNVRQSFNIISASENTKETHRWHSTFLTSPHHRIDKQHAGCCSVGWQLLSKDGWRPGNHGDHAAEKWFSVWRPNLLGNKFCDYLLFEASKLCWEAVFFRGYSVQFRP